MHPARYNHMIRKVIVLAAALATLPGMQGRVTDLEDRLLAIHNHERAAMGVPPLRWSEELAEGAQEWADYLSETGKFEHSPNEPGQPLEGENIWGGTPGAYSAEAMIGLWLAEKEHFEPGRFPNNSTTDRVADVSHYTQVIWDETHQVGCGLSRKGEEEILVCRYRKPGNVIGERPLS